MRNNLEHIENLLNNLYDDSVKLQEDYDNLEEIQEKAFCMEKDIYYIIKLVEGLKWLYNDEEE